MEKLINAHRANPSSANFAKLQKYLDNHMMAVCMASAIDVAYLKANFFTI